MHQNQIFVTICSPARVYRHVIIFLPNGSGTCIDYRIFFRGNELIIHALHGSTDAAWCRCCCCSAAVNDLYARPINLVRGLANHVVY